MLLVALYALKRWTTSDEDRRQQEAMISFYLERMVTL